MYVLSAKQVKEAGWDYTPPRHISISYKRKYEVCIVLSGFPRVIIHEIRIRERYKTVHSENGKHVHTRHYFIYCIYNKITGYTLTGNIDLPRDIKKQINNLFPKLLK